jgi:hypothetical protein
VLSNLPEVHTLAAMGLLWALEKGYYAAGSCVIHKLRGVSLLGILQECGELGRMMPWGH